MKSFPFVLSFLLGLFALLGSGCVSLDDEEGPTERRAAATLLTLIDESHQLTPEQMEERRRNVISYLVAEGYIYSGDDLVQSASYADQIIRAKLALDGSFELTIYRPEHLAHHEVAFDPAGYPVYTYFPGDMGYLGNGFDPYYIPVAPYYGPRHPHDRSWPRRDHDSRPPDRPRPPGSQPDWNRDSPRPPTGDNDRHDGHQGSPSTQQPGGNQNRHHDRDHRPDGTSQPPVSPQPGQPDPGPVRTPNHRPNGDHQQTPQNPVQPPVTSPVQQPPVQNPPVQPNVRRTGPDRQPWAPHQPPPPVPQVATPVPATATPQPPPSGQTDHRRFRPELQPQQPPSAPSRPAPTSPPPPNQNRTRPEGSPPKTTPPPARTPPQQRTIPEPAKDQSNKSDSTTQSGGGTNPDDRRR